MTTRYNGSARAAKQAFELSLAVPQVIAHRTLRMAQAGSRPSLRDQHEFWTMGFEKVAAFNEAWIAMATEATRIQQKWAWSALVSLWFPWSNTQSGLGTAAAQWRRAALDVSAKGMAPVHRRAVANARRLGRAGG